MVFGNFRSFVIGVRIVVFIRNRVDRISICVMIGSCVRRIGVSVIVNYYGTCVCVIIIFAVIFVSIILRFFGISRIFDADIVLLVADKAFVTGSVRIALAV